MADSDQRREFLEEIQLMKAVGTHKNIVNMLGCCTVEEPMFLLVEYIPYGDLLHYLRKRRGKVHTNAYYQHNLHFSQSHPCQKSAKVVSLKGKCIFLSVRYASSAGKRLLESLSAQIFTDEKQPNP